MAAILYEDAAETIPGLLVTEFAAPGRSDRVARLMADNAEQRELIAALQTRNSVLAESNAALSRDLALARHDIATLKGENATPQRGAYITDVAYCMGRLLVEVEGDRDGFDILNVFVNGRWIDPEDAASAMGLERLRELVAEGMVA